MQKAKYRIVTYAGVGFEAQKRHWLLGWRAMPDAKGCFIIYENKDDARKLIDDDVARGPFTRRTKLPAPRVMYTYDRRGRFLESYW